MRLVIVCDLLSTFVRFRGFLAAEIRRQGHEVFVVYSQRDDVDEGFYGELTQMGIEFRLAEMNRTTINPFADLKYRGRLVALFRELQPDMILAYQAKAAVWASVAARQVGGIRTHVLFPGLGYLFSAGKGIRRKIVQRIAWLLYRYAFRGIDVAFFQNRDDYRTLQKHRILDRRTACHFVNGSGVPLDYFDFTAPPAGPVRFLMATRLLAEKGVREFVSAAKNVHERYPGRAEFVIAGGFDVNPTAIGREEIAKWEAEGVIRFVGHQVDVRPQLRSCSAFVLPSYYMEGTPRSILEAMSIGRLIITTNNRGCRETVEHGVNGFIVEKRNVIELQQAMATVIESPELVEKMGQASRLLAERKYDVRRVCEQMLVGLGLSIAMTQPKEECRLG